MKGVIILDTNFLVTNTGKINEIIPEIEKKDFLVYVPEIVREEYINIQLRRIKNIYAQLEKIKNNNLYFNVSFNSENEVLKKNEQGYRKSFLEYFGEKFISYNEEDTLKKVLERNRYKEPPFYNEANSSDKGFKDTIIWLSIKKFIQNGEPETKYYFITSDNGFIKYKQELEQEIDGDLEILDIKEANKLFEKFLINTENSTNSIDKNIFNQENKEVNIDEIREKINTLMWEFNNYIEQDWNGNSFEEKRYEIYKYINYANTEEFLNNIHNVIQDNIFRKSITVESFFKPEDEVFAKGEDINMDIANDIYELYNQIKNTEYKDSFIKFIMQKINENKTVKNTFLHDDDLPF